MSEARTKYDKVKGQGNASFEETEHASAIAKASIERNGPRAGEALIIAVTEKN